MGLAALCVVARRTHVHPVLDFEELEVRCELVLLARRGHRKRMALGLQFLERLSDLMKRSDSVKVLGPPELPSKGGHLRTDARERFRREEYRHQRVPTLANLAADRVDIDLESELEKRLVPGACMQVHRIFRHVERHDLKTQRSPRPKQ